MVQTWNESTVYDIANNSRERFNDGDWIEAAYIQKEGNRLIQTGNIGVGKFLDKPSRRYISDSSFSELNCKEVIPGDILICRLAEPAGRACIVPDIGERRMLTSVDVTIFRPDAKKADRRFMIAAMSTPLWFSRVNERVGGSTRTRISRSELGKIYIEMPPLDEQTRIGDAIESIDELVSVIQNLVAKKRAIKHGMMQELLTGRTRLPGFDGEWITLHVASVSHLKARIGWQGLTTGEYRTSGHYRLVGGTDFRDGKVNWSTTPYVDKWRFDQDRNIQLRVGDVLITKDGTIGKVAFVDSLPGPTTLNSGVFVVRPKNDSYDSGFLFHMLRSRFFDEFVAGLSAGSTINHLYQRDLVTLELRVPPTLDEQRAIAEALNDADTEIEALERHLQVTRDIKQGMMQELLTGRTRLPVDEEVAV